MEQGKPSVVVLLVGVAVAASLFFLALSGRYQYVQAGAAGGPAVRLDRLTGTVEVCFERVHKGGETMVSVECGAALTPY